MQKWQCYLLASACFAATVAVEFAKDLFARDLIAGALMALIWVLVVRYRLIPGMVENVITPWSPSTERRSGRSLAPGVSTALQSASGLLKGPVEAVAE